MANTITLKRSASAGKVPLATDLQLGELAVNTNDGKLYLKKDDGTPSIVEVGPVTSVAGRTGAVALSVSDVAGSVTSVAGRTGAVTLTGSDIAGVVTSVAGRTGAVALAIPDVADLSTSLVPVGAVVPFAGVSAPAKWLFCFGQNVSRTTYGALFTAIGTTYGAGNGSTTFTLPDLRGRTVAGQDDMGGTSANRLTGQSGGLNGDTLGATGGGETHTLATAELPSHSHVVDMGGALTTGSGGSHNHTFNYNERSKSGDGTLVSDMTGSGNTKTTSTVGSHTHSFDIPAFNSGSAGSGSAHNNVQPTMILNYMIHAGA
ncbi:phage tail protein [Bauldia litoralis]|uniref:Microcystin-dependent protein n=1 Tax=Bauldia litoralis TaxID=665467 RepID=A0A1G6EJM0_9HYPH|nr:tail fiber protein [Bauldia litoralis]SDB57542.1 Microcystin-dependent protein [Bauldia litoralis]